MEDGGVVLRGDGRVLDASTHHPAVLGHTIEDREQKLQAGVAVREDDGEDRALDQSHPAGADLEPREEMRDVDVDASVREQPQRAQQPQRPQAQQHVLLGRLAGGSHRQQVDPIAREAAEQVERKPSLAKPQRKKRTRADAA